MSDQMIFKRYEIKYLINKSQLDELKNLFRQHMVADVHGQSTICSLYFDTPDFLLARRSIEHPIYKEKLRLRSYGVATPDTTVFIELKKKYKSVVYKRRISMSESSACDYLIHRISPDEKQITNEINYVLDIYKDIAPAIMLSYQREAFYAKNDHDFRVTFDTNVLWRDYDLSLTKGIYGNPILGKDQVLMEVKTAGAIPMWLVDYLSKNHIYKTSFSKYGTAYKTIYNNQNGGIYNYA